MPELPEVETVRRGLLPAMEGQRIDQAQVNRPDLRFALPPNMAARLTGHVVLTMESGARVTFNDPRRFGAMDLMPTANWQAHKLLADLGPEPLGNGFNEAYLAHRLENRATPIKSALLDQKVVSGLGNIYVCEVLHRAGIAPTRLAGDLTAQQAAALVPLIRAVLVEAIEAGGSSLRDYRQADGELGYFQHTFRVYDREGQPCPACATLIVRLVQSGRSSFYCPSCQR